MARVNFNRAPACAIVKIKHHRIHLCDARIIQNKCESGVSLRASQENFCVRGMCGENQDSALSYMQSDFMCFCITYQAAETSPASL